VIGLKLFARAGRRILKSPIIRVIREIRGEVWWFFPIPAIPAMTRDSGDSPCLRGKFSRYH
jgi:hypothetical protein